MNESEDFFSQYFDLYSDTESPTIYYRWCAITGIAAILGRRCYIQHGHRRIYPNFYTMLIGGPGTRKGSAIATIKDLLIGAGYYTFASTKTSKEKFLQDLGAGFTYAPSVKADEINAEWEDLLEEAGTNGKETKEVFVCLDEFQDFIGASNVEFISLLTTLWDNLPFYDHRIKTGKSVFVYEPTINILSGSTPTGFATAFPPEIIGQGMLSRLLLIYSESTGVKIPWPGMPSDTERNRLATRLQDIKRIYNGPAGVSAEAKDLMAKIYTGWVDIDDARLKNYSNRRFTHLLKLCIICMAAYGRKEIDSSTVIYANSILAFAEQRMSNALGEFGKSKHADVSGKILNFLDEAKEPVKLMIGPTSLWKLVHSDLQDTKELVTIMSNLVNAEKVQRTADGFLPKRIKRLTTDTTMVDFSLLREAR